MTEGWALGLITAGAFLFVCWSPPSAGSNVHCVGLLVQKIIWCRAWNFCSQNRGRRLLRVLLQNVIAQLSDENFPRKLYLVFRSFISGNLLWGVTCPIFLPCVVPEDDSRHKWGWYPRQECPQLLPCCWIQGIHGWVLLSHDEISAYFDWHSWCCLYKCCRLMVYRTSTWQR